jgi:hypothetical protein
MYGIGRVIRVLATAFITRRSKSKSKALSGIIAQRTVHGEAELPEPADKDNASSA